MQLTVGSHTFGAPVAFIASPTSYGLAGQQGFFSLRVTFNLAAEELELAPFGR